MNELLETVADSIFYGTVLSAPILMIIRLFNIMLRGINIELLVRSVNRALLLASLFFIGPILVEIYVAVFSGGEYERYRLSTRITGPFWFEFWIPGVISQSLLPQILWIRKLQKSITYTFFIVVIWGLSSIIIGILLIDTEWHYHRIFAFTEYLLRGTIYIIIVGGNYLLLNKRTIRSKEV